LREDNAVVIRKPTKIGIIGCGVISGIYIENSKRLDSLECVAVADVNPAAARFRAEQYDIPRACSPDELLADPDVEIVVNLTPNLLHAQVALQILEAGRHLYGEKPFTVYREDSRRILALAAEKGLRVGGAPDTFFGGAWQTARKAIDDGLIGRPFAATAVLHWRQSAAEAQGSSRPTSPTRATVPGSVSFFQTDAYKYGGTVTFDMGPYYLTSLINLLGPAKRVTGVATKVSEEASRFGAVMTVEAPTHVVGIVEFESGAVAQIVFSSDAYGTGLPHLEIYGTEGTLRCGDPNNFPGSVHVRRPKSRELVELDCKHAYNQDSRGVGLADLAVAIRNGRPHRASGEMVAHVVDILNSLHESSDQGRRIDLTTTCVQPKALPIGLPNWEIDD
jgi:predicted dehydrogenase